MAIKSKYNPINKKKYIGRSPAICRSTWERALAKHLDMSPTVVKWGMECVVIPYYDIASGKQRRYFMDFVIQYNTGKILLVEVKPEHQTKSPKKRKQTTKYLREVATYATNYSKWTAANEYAENKGWHFQVWTEHILRKLGIPVV